MPYVLSHKGKGPIWSMFDRYFSPTDLAKRLRHKLEVLWALHANPRFTDFDRGPGSSGITVSQLALLKQHINRDWFGLSDDGSSSITPADGCTGAWQGWRGDAEGIVREALIRGIEVSLGLDHLSWTGDRPEPLQDYGIGSYGTPRNLPMEFWCVAPFPYLQAAVSWRDSSEGGCVEIDWLVPAAAGQEFLSELGASTGHFAVDPPNPGGESAGCGSWIVGQAQTQPQAGGGGQSIQVSSGAVVVVQPTLEAGGVPAGD